MATGGEIVHGRDFTSGFDETCDAIVVGSGAGGAVVASHLADAGWRVIVLEEGPYYKPEEYGQFRPSESMRRMWREAGILAAFGVGPTPIISISVGRNVGGSSVHTGGVCFRIPSSIHHNWVRELGLNALSEKNLEKAYIDVEKRINVREILPEERSRSTDAFIRGAEKMGIPMSPISRNTRDCDGLGRCNFGCPKGAKMSVDISYLPNAVRHGTRVISDALVERVLFSGDRATGVEGRLLNTKSDSPLRFTVKAKVVVIACGTLHSPLLLQASGANNVHIGRHVTLHPASRVCAFFDEKLNGWDGALQSVYSNHFEKEGITLVGAYSPPNVLVAGLPGFGPAHRKLARELPFLGVFGGMIHDEGGGMVRQAPFGREGVVSYEMAPRDLTRLRQAMVILGEMAFAAGARQVILPVFGVPPIRDLKMLRKIHSEPLDASPHRMPRVSPTGVGTYGQ